MSRFDRLHSELPREWAPHQIAALAFLLGLIPSLLIALAWGIS